MPETIGNDGTPDPDVEAVRRWILSLSDKTPDPRLVSDLELAIHGASDNVTRREKLQDGLLNILGAWASDWAQPAATVEDAPYLAARAAAQSRGWIMEPSALRAIVAAALGAARPADRMPSREAMREKITADPDLPVEAGAARPAL